MIFIIIAILPIALYSTTAHFDRAQEIAVQKEVVGPLYTEDALCHRATFHKMLHTYLKNQTIYTAQESFDQTWAIVQPFFEKHFKHFPKLLLKSSFDQLPKDDYLHYALPDWHKELTLRQIIDHTHHIHEHNSPECYQCALHNECLAKFPENLPNKLIKKALLSLYNAHQAGMATGVIVVPEMQFHIFQWFIGLYKGYFIVPSAPSFSGCSKWKVHDNQFVNIHPITYHDVAFHIGRCTLMEYMGNALTRHLNGRQYFQALAQHFLGYIIMCIPEQKPQSARATRTLSNAITAKLVVAYEFTHEHPIHPFDAYERAIPDISDTGITRILQTLKYDTDHKLDTLFASIPHLGYDYLPILKHPACTNTPSDCIYTPEDIYSIAREACVLLQNRFGALFPTTCQNAPSFSTQTTLRSNSIFHLFLWKHTQFYNSPYKQINELRLSVVFAPPRTALYTIKSAHQLQSVFDSLSQLHDATIE